MGISAVQTLQSTGPAAANAPAAGLPADAPDKDEEADFTFDDLIDIINPLHHLPVVSTIYRAFTGDEISVHARALGGGLYGGPIGLLAAGATMAVEEASGLSASNSLASLFSDGDDAAELAAAPASGSLQPSDRLMAVPPQAPAANPAAAQAALPFTAKGAPKFFALADPKRPDSIPLPSRAQAPQAQAQPNAAADTAVANGLALTKTEGDLLDAFIRGNGQPQSRDAEQRQDLRRQSALPAERPYPAHSLAPPPGAGPAWFANQMEANLQKYAAAQANGAQAR
jgi:hypothetical protein